jgi:hypothetical protein
MGQAELVEELARPVAVPDLDALLAERERRCVALDEPEELEDDGAVEDSFRREEGQDGTAVVVEFELEAGSEDGYRAGACAVD